MIELVAFLGNHGREYAKNRHNAAWMLAEALPFAPSLSWQKKYKGRYAALDSVRLPVLDAPDPSGSDAAQEMPARLHFLMPETFMNLSGDSVHEAASFFKIPPDRILIVHDELELPLGFASLKFSGGLGGHNGLRSMKARFGTADFWRLRIGIGRPDHSDISGWVLSDFSLDERILLDLTLPKVAVVLTRALRDGPEKLLPEWNKKRIAE